MSKNSLMPTSLEDYWPKGAATEIELEWMRKAMREVDHTSSTKPMGLAGVKETHVYGSGVEYVSKESYLKLVKRVDELERTIPLMVEEFLKVLNGTK